MNCICIAVFGIEIILNMISKPEYNLSFNFFLDLISTSSIILDIGWITDSFYPEVKAGVNAS